MRGVSSGLNMTIVLGLILLLLSACAWMRKEPVHVCPIEPPGYTPEFEDCVAFEIEAGQMGPCVEIALTDWYAWQRSLRGLPMSEAPE